MARSEAFYDWHGPRHEVTVGERRSWLPLCYHDNDVFASLHAASYAAVCEELPSDVIRPARWVDGRALVMVQVFRYHAVTWTGSDGSAGGLVPYGEISISAAVTLGSAPRMVPLLQRRQAGFVLHLPVTTREARDGGRQLYGFPKFLADMEFEEAPGSRRVRLSEGGSHILTLTVRPRGPAMVDTRPLVAYTALDGQLRETVIPVFSHVQTRLGKGGGALLLGEHAVADRVRRLGLSPTPLAVFNYLDHRSILPAAGRTVGPARDYAPYPGSDAETGRYTVTYPDTPPIDQYATPQLVH